MKAMVSVVAVPGPGLTARDYRTLSLATLGGLLEFYDFIVFVFFANTIGELFFPAEIPDWLRQFQTFGIFAAGYLARPLGGIAMAHAGDLSGRKQMFTLSIFLMALPTLGVGLLPTYTNLGIWAPILLLLLRILQGGAVGGEVPGAWVFVSEHVNPSRVGLACGILTGGLTGGILLGSLVATSLSIVMTHDQLAAYGWRISLRAWRRLRFPGDVRSSFISRDTCVFRVESAPSTCVRDAAEDGCVRLSWSRRPQRITDLDAVCGHCCHYPVDARLAPKGVRCPDYCRASRQQPGIDC